VRRFNLAGGDLEHETDRDGFRKRQTRVADAIGATQIGGSLYELPAGERSFPYHFHHGVEEWLLVVDGTPTLRTPDGERELRAGDCVCFPDGPDGAHTLRGPGRVLVISNGSPVSIAVYPDSDKLGTRPGWSHDNPDRLDFRRADAVDYWEGE
jgi:uncharacterized cupin superfamily protein